MTKDETVGWLHQLNGHEFEQAPGFGDGQERLECCSLWGSKELDMNDQLNNNCRGLQLKVWSRDKHHRHPLRVFEMQNLRLLSKSTKSEHVI